MVSKCCCCIPLRTGCIILGVLGILSGIGLLATEWRQWFYVIEAVIFFAAYGPLLFGAIQYNQRAVLVSLGSCALLILYGTVIGIIIAMPRIETFRPELANNCAGVTSVERGGISCDDFTQITDVSAFLIGSVLDIYFWICMYSFYKDLKTGANNPV